MFEPGSSTPADGVDIDVPPTNASSAATTPAATTPVPPSTRTSTSTSAAAAAVVSTNSTNTNTNANTGTNTSTTTAAAAAAKRDPKVFVHKLYSMLHDENQPIAHLIWWSPSSDYSFFLVPNEEFSNKVLLKYFKHSNISSFVRQLNMYGFHKVNDKDASGSASSPVPSAANAVVPNKWEFAHNDNHFRKNDFDGLKFIKRRSAKNNNNNSSNSGNNNNPMSEKTDNDTDFAADSTRSNYIDGSDYSNPDMSDQVYPDVNCMLLEELKRTNLDMLSLIDVFLNSSSNENSSSSFPSDSSSLFLSVRSKVQTRLNLLKRHRYMSSSSGIPPPVHQQAYPTPPVPLANPSSSSNYSRSFHQYQQHASSSPYENSSHGSHSQQQFRTSSYFSKYPSSASNANSSSSSSRNFSITYDPLEPQVHPIITQQPSGPLPTTPSGGSNSGGSTGSHRNKSHSSIVSNSSRGTGMTRSSLELSSTTTNVANSFNAQGVMSTRDFSQLYNNNSNNSNYGMSPSSNPSTIGTGNVDYFNNTNDSHHHNGTHGQNPNHQILSHSHFRPEYSSHSTNIPERPRHSSNDVLFDSTHSSFSNSNNHHNIPGVSSSATVTPFNNKYSSSSFVSTTPYNYPSHHSFSTGSGATATSASINGNARAGHPYHHSVTGSIYPPRSIPPPGSFPDFHHINNNFTTPSNATAVNSIRNRSSSNSSSNNSASLLTSNPPQQQQHKDSIIEHAGPQQQIIRSNSSTAADIKSSQDSSRNAEANYPIYNPKYTIDYTRNSMVSSTTTPPPAQLNSGVANAKSGSISSASSTIHKKNKSTNRPANFVPRKHNNGSVLSLLNNGKTNPGTHNSVDSMNSYAKDLNNRGINVDDENASQLLASGSGRDHENSSKTDSDADGRVLKRARQS